MKKWYLVFFYLALAFCITSSLYAAPTLYDDFASWEAAVDSYSNFTEYGNYNDPLVSLDVGYHETVNFDITMVVREVGLGWVPVWSGDYTDDILFASGTSSLTGNFSSGQIFDAFGFYAQPAYPGNFDMTLTLANSQPITRKVSSNEAEFFGWTTDIPVTSFIISKSPDPEGEGEAGFAIADFYSSPIPEPGTILLLGIGLVGLAAYQRKSIRR